VQVTFDMAKAQLSNPKTQLSDPKTQLSAPKAQLSEQRHRLPEMNRYAKFSNPGGFILGNKKRRTTLQFTGTNNRRMLDLYLFAGNEMKGEAETRLFQGKMKCVVAKITLFSLPQICLRVF